MTNDFAYDMRTTIRQHLPKGGLFRYHCTADTVVLDQLRLPTTGGGVGTGFLMKVLAVCDQHQCKVRGCADPTDEPQDPGSEDLVRMYRRLGFEPYRADDNGVWIRRAPQGLDEQGIRQAYQAARVHDWTHDAWTTWLEQARLASGCGALVPRARRRGPG